MEPFEIWKAVAIGLTGAFGMLGVATESRDAKSKRVTKWGYVSLAGILLSSAGGIWAQLAETDSHQKAAEESNKRILAIVSATSGTLENTRRVIDTTNRTTSDIRRLVSPLGSSRVMLSWEVPCQANAAYRTVCDEIARRRVGDAPFTLKESLPWPHEPRAAMRAVVFEPQTGDPPVQLSGNSFLPANPSGPRYRLAGADRQTRIQLDELYFFDPPAGGALQGLYELAEGTASISIADAPYTDFTLVSVRWIGERGNILISEIVQSLPAQGDTQRRFQFKLKPLTRP